jgi:hypothetical protein
MIGAMSDPATSGSMNPQQLTTLFKWMAAGDFVAGAALVAIGLYFEETVVSAIGLVLLLSGTAVLAWMIVRGNRPTEM